MLTFEDRFRQRYPDYRVVETPVSSCLSRYRVFIGKIEFSESAVRDLAFKYALEEAAGIKLPAAQMELWPA